MQTLTKFSNFAFSVVLSMIFVLCATPAALAAQTEHMQLVVYKVGEATYRNQNHVPMVVKDDSEIGSTQVMKVIPKKSDLGGYSLKDGSMRGAYGDGVYGD